MAIEFDLTRDQVLEIYCRDCGAIPGEQCEASTGKIRREPHFLRKLDREKGVDPMSTQSPETL
jgi:hypothetical protein